MKEYLTKDFGEIKSLLPSLLTAKSKKANMRFLCPCYKSFETIPSAGKLPYYVVVQTGHHVRVGSDP